MRRHPYLLAAIAASVLAAACSESDGSGVGNPAAPSGGSLQVLVDVPIAVESTAGLVGTWNWVGQSVTLPPGSRFDTLRFNWYLYAGNAGQPTAFGTLYILDRPYTGLPSGLGPTMPGFIAASAPAPVDPTGGAGQGAEYSFADNVALSGGTTYWFYTDAQGAFANTFDTDAYAGGQMYHTGYALNPFQESQASGRLVDGVFVPAPAGLTIDANFRLRGIAR